MRRSAPVTGDRRAQRDAGDVVVEREAVEAEELLDHERVLVGGALGVGGDPPVVEQVRVGQPAPDVGSSSGSRS